MTKIYHFDPVTHEFTRDSEARTDPIDKTPMVPGSATLVAPPVTPDGHAAVWLGAEWGVQVDLRGREYWLDDGSRHMITDLGVDLPAGALDEAPAVPVHKTADDALRAAYLWIEAFVHENVDGMKPKSEISAYWGRELAARAVLQGTETSQQRADLLALLTFEGKSATEAEAALPALVDRIVELADARNTALALTTAMREKVEALIADAAIAAASDPFAFDTVLSQAADDARAAWAALNA